MPKERINQIVKEVLTKQTILSPLELKEITEIFLARKQPKDPDKVVRNFKKHLAKDWDINLDENGSKQTTNNKIKKYTIQQLPKFLLEKGSALNDQCLLSVQWLKKTIGDRVLFNQVNFLLNKKDKIALIGRNGTGKSTLLKILIGKTDYNDGNIHIAKGLKIGFLSQDILWENKERTLVEEMNTTLPAISDKIHRLQKIEVEIEQEPDKINQLVEEQLDIINYLNIEEGFKKYELQKDILKYFGFKEEQLELHLSNLSGGEQIKIQIAKFMLQQVDLLILDEPTNHLDIEGILFLEKFLLQWKKGLICISHDKRFINNIFQNIWEIDQEKINFYKGNYDFYLVEKTKNYNLVLKKKQEQEKFFTKQKKFIERFRYKDSKAKAVQSRIRMLEKIDKIEKPIDEKSINELSLNTDIHIPNTVITMTNLKIGYPHNHLLTLPKKLEIFKEQQIGIIGPNGVGKSTFLETIIGQLPNLGWEVTINDKIKVAYYSQIAEDLNPDKTIIEELVFECGFTQKEVRAILGGLLIVGEKVNQKISTLSGGEKSKVALTKLILQKPHLLIMDEPTNHLDIFSKDAVKNMLANFDGVSIIVSHDRDLLAGISTNIWLIKDKKLRTFLDLEKGFEVMMNEM